MSARMVSRGGKTRFVCFFCMILVLSAVLYVFHGTHEELNDARQSVSLCTHQLESISSQLQVIVEHKLKLEKSLEDEKREHLKTKEDLNAIIQDEKELRDKQNADSVNRYSEIERSHEVLLEEEKKLREEFEKLKINYLKEDKKNKKLTQDLKAAINEVQNLKNEKIKLPNGKENVDNNQNNKLQKSNELSDVKFIEKSNDNINVTKLSSVTPAINPQAIDGATAKSSTPMVSLKIATTNESAIENGGINPIIQPKLDSNAINDPNIAFESQNETNQTQESQVNENESIKSIDAPPQEETVKKDQLKMNEEEKVPKQKKSSYDYEQDHFKEDEDDEDVISDFDAREDNQQIRYTK